jgi:predicted ATPase/DNA-binding CsgD family transcriptional regulator
MADSRSHSASLAEPLTEREQEILTCLVEGLSNREIADQLFLSPSTVKWYNSQIYSKLGVSKREAAVDRAQALGLVGSTPERPPPDTRYNLPAQTTAFVGRHTELAGIAHLLGQPDTRLVTILAPGGMGKTRLALAAAEGELRHFADGVFFVPLAPLGSPDNIVTAVADHVGFTFYGSDLPTKQLLDYFREREILLVMDNFEHLLDGATLVGEMLQAAPQVKVLVTSREKLKLSGETVFTLSGLHFPDWETPEDALDYDAVKLFMQSAQRVRPDFALQADDLTYLARICRLTGGMPLGIVLAASWLDVMSLERIAGEIQQGIDILETDMRDVPDRQRSVRATFNYSWARLSEAEQEVFMKLSVFRGGFTSEAARIVAGADVRLLRRLVSKALVQALPDDRYTLHELLSQYGGEQLAAAGKRESIRAAHARYYANFMQLREADLKSHRMLAGTNAIQADFENVRQAWFWAVTQKDHDAVNQMVETLWQFGFIRHFDYKAFFRSALEQLMPDPGETPHPVWGRVLSRTFYLAEDPVIRVQEALSIARFYGDRAEIAYCLQTLGVMELLVIDGDPVAAAAYYEESLHHFQAIDDRFGVADVLDMLGECHRQQGQPEMAFDYFAQGLALSRTIDNKVRMVRVLRAMGDYALGIGRYAEAEQYAREALAITHDMSDRWGASSYLVLGLLPLLRGDFDKAQMVIDDALAWSTDHNDPIVKGAALLLQGWVAGLESDYITSLQLCTAGQELIAKDSADPRIPFLAHLGLALIAHGGLGDHQSVRRHGQALLETAVPTRQIAAILSMLPLAAVVLARDGQPEEAVELLALAFTHPTGITGWMDRWSLLTDLRRDLEADLGAETYAAAWERGTQFDVETVARQLLAAWSS